MASDHYLYKDLRPGQQIRLLTVFPSRDNNSDIRTSLRVHNIPNPNLPWHEKFQAYFSLPPYIAVSYRWILGNSQTILVNNQPFQVHGHLHDALRIFRSFTGVHIRFWIDSICINQENDSEKSEQIPLMPYIYGLSFQTWIWLEMPNDESKRAERHVSNFLHDPWVVKARYAYLEVQSTTPVAPAYETFFARLRRILRAECIRLAWTLCVRLLILPLGWLATRFSIIDEQISREDAMACRFKTLEEYTLSGMDQETTILEHFQSGLQLGLQQDRIRRLHKRGLSENALNQIASQRATVLGNFMDGFREGYNKSAKKPKVADELVNSALQPTTSSTSAIMQPRKMMAAATTTKSDDKPKTWQPSAQSLLSIDRNEFKALAELINRTLFSKTEYFNRMWTLQEVCATKIPMVSLGGNLIALADLLKVLHYLEAELGTESAHVKKAVRLQWINAEHRMRRRLPLRTLLYESRDRHCSDPRDKIYALLGLMLERPTILVKPAYDQDPEVVYANATRFLIAADRSLDVICGHDRQKRLPNYPSWTPDFSQFAVDDSQFLIDLSGRTTVYKASLKEPPQNILDPTCLPDDWKSLGVQAIYLGTIAHLSNTNSVNESVLKRAQDWKLAIQHNFKGDTQEVLLLQTSFELVQHCCDYSTDNATAHESRWLSTPEGSRVLHDLALSLSELDDEEQHHLCSKYVMTLICARLDTSSRCDFADVINRLYQPLDKAQQQASSRPFPEILYDAIDGATAGRRLFVTENAKVLGAAPTSAEEQDQVFVLLGCSVPVVLRRLQEGEYTLVGECYCHGMMDGEAEKDADVRDIVLL
jgi:hypothetical protein